MRGFTLIETLIYLALFSMLFTGILLSSYGFFTSVEHVSSLVVGENEAAFVIYKINAILNASRSIAEPTTHGDVLRVTTTDSDVYIIRNVEGAITLQKNSASPVLLTAERVTFSNFSATNTPKNAGLPHHLEYTFSVDGTPISPIRTYVSF